MALRVVPGGSSRGLHAALLLRRARASC